MHVLRGQLFQFWSASPSVEAINCGKRLRCTKTIRTFSALRLTCRYLQEHQTRSKIQCRSPSFLLVCRLHFLHGMTLFYPWATLILSSRPHRNYQGPSRHGVLATFSLLLPPGSVLLLLSFPQATNNQFSVGIPCQQPKGFEIHEHCCGIVCWPTDHSQFKLFEVVALPLESGAEPLLRLRWERAVTDRGAELSKTAGKTDFPGGSKHPAQSLCSKRLWNLMSQWNIWKCTT